MLIRWLATGFGKYSSGNNAKYMAGSMSDLRDAIKWEMASMRRADEVSLAMQSHGKGLKRARIGLLVKVDKRKAVRYESDAFAIKYNRHGRVVRRPCRPRKKIGINLPHPEWWYDEVIAPIVGIKAIFVASNATKKDRQRAYQLSREFDLPVVRRRDMIKQ